MNRPGFEERIVMVSALPSTIIMEMVNEFVFKEKGMFYPASIFYFPGCSFPLAIILFGSIYSWAIFVLGRAVAAKMFSTTNRNAAQIILMLIGINSWYLVEQAGLFTGYWAMSQEIHYSMKVIFGSYLFYWLFSFPPMVIALFWGERKFKADIL